MKLRAHDHVLVLYGIADGHTSWGLSCVHPLDDDRYFIDCETQERTDECLLDAWFDNEGPYLCNVGAANHPIHTPVPIWTHWNLDHTPVLLGRAQAQRFLDLEGVQP